MTLALQMAAILQCRCGTNKMGSLAYQQSKRIQLQTSHPVSYNCISRYVYGSQNKQAQKCLRIYCLLLPLLGVPLPLPPPLLLARLLGRGSCNARGRRATAKNLLSCAGAGWWGCGETHGAIGRAGPRGLAVSCPGPSHPGLLRRALHPASQRLLLLIQAKDSSKDASQECNRLLRQAGAHNTRGLR
jgi:hypothetical protein